MPCVVNLPALEVLILPRLMVWRFSDEESIGGWTALGRPNPRRWCAAVVQSHH